MADRARDPEALEREIELTRVELARTIDALADRVTPKNMARRGVARIREEAGQVRATLTAMVSRDGSEEKPSLDPRAMAVIGAGAAVTVAAVLLWRRRRR